MKYNTGDVVRLGQGVTVLMLSPILWLALE